MKLFEENMDAILERLPLGVRLYTAASAVLLMVGSVVNVAAPACYTDGIVSLYLIGLSTLTLLCEFSPYGLNVLMGVCPLLGEYLFRGLLYIWLVRSILKGQRLSSDL